MGTVAQYLTFSVESDEPKIDPMNESADFSPVSSSFGSSLSHREAELEMLSRWSSWKRASRMRPKLLILPRAR